MDELEQKLLEVKDTSELMVDLAYSSLLYNNREIAQEVMELEEYTDELTSSIQKEAIRRAMSDGDASRAFVTIKLIESLEGICDAASGIAGVVMKNVEPHPVIKMSIRESEVTIATAMVIEGSDLSDKTLGESRLASQSGMWVVAIKRGRKYIYGPDEDTVVLVGDTLIVRGPKDGEEFFKDLASGKTRLS
ncbi:MAG TPA: TrkA C-terminal domain-containing protein [Methanomassiliicoccales archaeon]|nr:TrkA C-terminal domain-containing protein [Methanomassiliicoccales archaeon]